MWSERRQGVAALLVAGALGLGCGAGAAETIAAPDEAFRWAAQVRERVAAAGEQPCYAVRYNPVACDCTPYEIELGGHWHRVAFVGVGPEDEVLRALDTAVAEAEGRGAAATWQLQGSLDDALTTCARGAIVVGLSPSAFGAPEPEPPDEDEDEDEATGE